MSDYKVKAWSWCADYCKKNHWNPYDSYFWDKAMLEYRRENNIFEVGDFVLLISSKFSDDVLELTEDYLGLDFKYKSRSGSFGFILKSFMPTKWRHATQKEIQAGRRL